VKFLKIEILGKGCSKCNYLEKTAREAVQKAGINAEIEHVYDLNKIIERNVFSTPALVIDGKVVIAGRLPTVEEVTALLKKN